LSRIGFRQRQAEPAVGPGRRGRGFLVLFPRRGANHLGPRDRVVVRAGHAAREGQFRRGLGGRVLVRGGGRRLVPRAPPGGGRRLVRRSARGGGRQRAQPDPQGDDGDHGGQRQHRLVQNPVHGNPLGKLGDGGGRGARHRGQDRLDQSRRGRPRRGGDRQG